MALTINGRMKVKTLKNDFRNAFSLSLRVYDGRNFADDETTLASIREGDSKGTGDFAPRKNTKIQNFEEKMMQMFGIKTRVSGSDDSYLCKSHLTLAGAQEEDVKIMERRVKKAERNADSSPDSVESQGEVPEIIANLRKAGAPGKIMLTTELADFLKDLPGNLVMSEHEIYNIFYTDMDMNEIGEQDYTGGGSIVYVMSNDADDTKTPTAIAFIGDEVASVLFGWELDELNEWLAESYFPLHCPDLEMKNIDWSLYASKLSLNSDTPEEYLAYSLFSAARDYSDPDMEFDECFDFLLEDDHHYISASRTFIRSFDSELGSRDTGFLYLSSTKEMTLTSAGASYSDSADNNQTVAIEELASEIYSDMFSQFFELDSDSDGFEEDDDYSGAMVMCLETPRH